jgi:hypothetical protein
MPYCIMMYCEVQVCKVTCNLQVVDVMVSQQFLVEFWSIKYFQSGSRDVVLKDDRRSNQSYDQRKGHFYLHVNIFWYSTKSLISTYTERHHELRVSTTTMTSNGINSRVLNLFPRGITSRGISKAGIRFYHHANEHKDPNLSVTSSKSSLLHPSRPGRNESSV